MYAKLFWLCAKLGRPKLAAALAVPVLQQLHGKRGQGRRTVIVLPKDGFTQDVMSVLATLPDMTVLGLPRIILREASAAFLPFFIDDNNYASCGLEFEGSKRRYKEFLAIMLQELQKQVPFEGILTGNFGYARERELAAAASGLGIPFIALHKENLKTPGRVAMFERVYRERRGRFGGKKILVYNAVEKALQERSGVAEPAAIEVVGMPRLDAIHDWRRRHGGEVVSKRILFFMFSAVSGMPGIPRKTSRRGVVRLEEVPGETQISLAQLCQETCAAILALARQRPDISVQVKTKGRQRDLTEVLQNFGVGSAAELPPNLALVHGGDILPLLSGASAVCGFNTTALLEAIAAGKPVVMPWFAEAESDAVAPFVIDLRPATQVAQSGDDLIRILATLADDPMPVAEDLAASQAALLQHWTGNVDGKSGARAGRAILAALETADGDSRKAHSSL
ncbi:MAG TPA: hypothetical protein VGN80_08330 [Devosiaceae bacterium]|nr:hypothetical protein [Devosiaceae bacterium]